MCMAGLPAVPQRTTGAWDAYMARVEPDAVFGPGFADPRPVHCKVASLTCGHGMHYLCYVQYLSTCRPRLETKRSNMIDRKHRSTRLRWLCLLWLLPGIGTAFPLQNATGGNSAPLTREDRKPFVVPSESEV